MKRNQVDQENISAPGGNLIMGKVTKWCMHYYFASLRKQLTFGDPTTGFPTKWRLRNQRRNSTLMTRHYPDLGSASDWSCHVGNLFQPTSHLAGKPVVASPNVGSFLRLLLCLLQSQKLLSFMMFLSSWVIKINKVSISVDVHILLMWSIVVCLSQCNKQLSFFNTDHV